MNKPLYKFYDLENLTQEDLNKLALERNIYKSIIDKIKELINNMKPLSLVETSIKEELKSAYNPKESSIKGTDKYFDTVCHLEDFEVQIWNIKELLEEVE